MTAEERIQILKNAIRIEPGFCIERARLYTQSHKETTNLPPALRRAKAMEKIMTERSAIIFDQELLVGNPTSKRVAAPILPEVARWLLFLMLCKLKNHKILKKVINKILWMLISYLPSR